MPRPSFRRASSGCFSGAVSSFCSTELSGQTPKPHSVAEHDKVSEVYYILEGTATFKTGPDLVSPSARPGDAVTVVQQNGPGFDADSIDNALTMELKPGDVVIIPAGTGHWFTNIPDHITYVMVRLDPGKILPLNS